MATITAASSPMATADTERARAHRFFRSDERSEIISVSALAPHTMITRAKNTSRIFRMRIAVAGCPSLLAFRIPQIARDSVKPAR